MSKQVVYNGSNCKVDKPEIRTGKYTKDFSNGFYYCTILKEQAKKWAKKYKTPVLKVLFVQKNL